MFFRLQYSITTMTCLRMTTELYFPGSFSLQGWRYGLTSFEKILEERKKAAEKDRLFIEQMDKDFEKFCDSIQLFRLLSEKNS